MSNLKLLNNKAPEFSLKGSDGKTHNLNEYKGKKVILYFYPKDNTPGCTIQAEEFRDNNDEIEKSNAVVLGISKDSIDSHNNFIEKLDLPFILLSDENGDVCKTYGVLKEKTMSIQRSTFLIDEEGTIVYENRNVSPKDQGNEILKVLKNLN
ncbi:MAG: peroxiredoxin [Clostridium sp.]|nr:peroxiredoxin [Clostridium sp.]